MPNPIVWSAQTNVARPQYQKLVEFLIEPLLENPSQMRVDCEQANQNQKIWVRISFDDTDKGRVYGRGGRNLQAIRTVVENAAALAGQSIYLDIYNDGGMEDQSFSSIPSGSHRGKFVKKTDRRRYRPRGSSSYRYSNEETL